MKKRYLIIDGYNMIGQSSTLSTVAKENLEEAREQLLGHNCQLQCINSR